MADINSPGLFLLGVVVKAHGTRGGFLLDISHVPESVLTLGKMFLQYPDHQWVPYRVEEIRQISDKTRNLFFVKLEDIQSRTIAESLRNYEIMTDEEPGKKIEEPSVIGYKAVRPDMSEIGEITDIISTPAYPVYVIQNHNKQILIPHVSEYVVKVCRDSKRLYVHNTQDLESLDSEAI